MSIINKSKGFTLVEILLILTVVMILTISVFLVYKKVSSDEIAKKEAENLIEIAASVKYFYSFSSDYKGLDNNSAIKNKLVPERLISSDKKSILNAYGFPITLKSSVVSPAGRKDTAFTIMYYSKNRVPTDVCVKLISKVKYNFYAIHVGNDLVKSDFGGQFVKFDVSKIKKTCETYTGAIQFTAY